jgi:GH15 family glucan-1,4-alpha-glucosidase
MRGSWSIPPVGDARAGGRLTCVAGRSQWCRASRRLRRHCINPDAQDGIDGGEGSFIACSFWLAHVKLLQGKRAEAEQLVHRLLSIANDLGLFSEEYDVAAQRLCGNFPQALSHVALINTVLAMGSERR